ncbi:nickel-dependent lactate racemase [Sphaerochaeta halotolerans]|uniref:Nickel-dependent lactate racemase n=1 Tax=Sphaerochaeta halotolerans TaxID=2293840 RepID=A0A372MEF3_9SPIR|nr:nickel-dependent lactate racemase [Sphaerochaeta halotolerans]RFU93768.1 nickel-dependent lactate racemase [Sphaerochaeta halotolerans]
MVFELKSGTMKEMLDISDLYIAGVVSPGNQSWRESSPLTDSQLAEAIDNPIGYQTVGETVGPGYKVAIVVDDATRPTPTRVILPFLLERLKKAGVADEDITITIGTGLHRPTTEQEREKILGSSVHHHFDLADNEVRNDEKYGLAGVADGKSIWLNKRILSAEQVFTIGVVKSHAFAGFTGGAKSILPAIASQRTIHENHCFHNIEYPRGILGSCEMSGTRKGMEEAARLVDPFIINVVLDGNNDIIFAAAGDVVQAHRKAVDFYAKSAMKSFPEEVDIALVYGGYAGSVSFYQALFGCNVVKTTQRPILKKGGIVVLYAECREGSGSRLFEEMMPAFDSPQSILDHLESSPVVDDQWAVQFLATFLRDMKVFVVSTGLSEDLAKVLRVRLFRNAKDAMEEAFSIAPKQAKVAVIENPDILIVNKS